MPKPPRTPASPAWIEPQVPTLVDKPPTGPNWRHEVKWDGYRVAIVIDTRCREGMLRRGEPHQKLSKASF